MYDIIIICIAKARIVYHQEFSMFFNCEYDVGQGENMSVFLFSSCLNVFLNISNVQSLSTISVMFENKLTIFPNFSLFYM